MSERCYNLGDYSQYLLFVSNKDLLDHVLELAQGDDWEGTFSRKGRIKYDLAVNELEKRLREIKFLDSQNNQNT